MSGAGGDRRVERPIEWDRLELSVRRLLDDYDRWRERARSAERRIGELEAALRDVAGGHLDPIALSARIEELEAENRELLDRLGRARERVVRLVDRLRFLEEER